MFQIGDRSQIEKKDKKMVLMLFKHNYLHFLLVNIFAILLYSHYLIDNDQRCGWNIISYHLFPLLKVLKTIN